MRFNMSRRGFLGSLAAGSLFPLAAVGPASTQTRPIRIGTLTPMTGGGGPFGPEIAEAHRKVVDLVNANGGILGRQIALTQEDSETNPEAGIRAARKLVDADGVMAVIGTWSSSVTLGIIPLCQEANVIQMCISAATQIEKVDKKGLVYNFQPLSPAWGKAIGELAIDRGFRSFAVMGLNNDFTTSMIDSFVAAVSAGGGNMVTSAFLYNEAQNSYRSEVGKLIEGNPDAVFIPSYVTDFTAVYRELYQSGYAGKVFTLSVSTGPQFKKAVGDAAEGVFHGFPVPPVDSDTYNAYLRFVGVEPNGEVQRPMGCAAYDQINTLLLGIASAGTDDVDVVKVHIRKIANGPGTKVTTVPEGLAALAAGQQIEYVGASSAVDFKPDSGTLVSRDFMLYQIKDGKDVPVKKLTVNS